MTTIELTETEIQTIWSLGSEFYMYEMVEVQGRQFTSTCEGPPHRMIITARALNAPRWTVSVLTRYEEPCFVADFSGNREAFNRDLFLLRFMGR